MSKKIDNSQYPSVDLVYDRAMRQYDIISMWIRAIDSKVAIIMGTSIIAFSVMVSIPKLKFSMELIPFAIGALFFVATIFTLLQCLKVHSFHVISNPRTLLAHYIKLNPEEAKLVFIKNSIKHYRENSEVLKQRAKYLNYSIYCMIGEILSLFIGLIII